MLQRGQRVRSYVETERRRMVRIRIVGRTGAKDDEQHKNDVTRSLARFETSSSQFTHPITGLIWSSAGSSSESPVRTRFSALRRTRSG